MSTRSCYIFTKALLNHEAVSNKRVFRDITLPKQYNRYASLKKKTVLTHRKQWQIDVIGSASSRQIWNRHLHWCYRDSIDVWPKYLFVRLFLDNKFLESWFLNMTPWHELEVTMCWFSVVASLTCHIGSDKKSVKKNIQLVTRIYQSGL